LEVYEIMAKAFPEEMTGPINKSLISNSEKKRNQKAQALAKQQQATWNQWNQAQQTKPTKPSAEAKLNNILLGGFGK